MNRIKTGLALVLLAVAAGGCTHGYFGGDFGRHRLSDRERYEQDRSSNYDQYHRTDLHSYWRDGHRYCVNDGAEYRCDP